MATLAGVSVEYLTRLEQGRDRRPSPAVLSTLADVLRLTTAERVHLYRLSKAADGFACAAGGPPPPARTVRPAVRAVLDRLEPAPAVLLNRATEVLAHTAGYLRLAGPLGMLDGDPPTLARYVFTDDRARAAFPDWDRVADEQVAVLKQIPVRRDPHLAALVEELTIAGGAAFARRLDTRTGVVRPSGVQRLVHPETGELRLAYETLDLADDDQRILVHLPADDATSAALDRLAAGAVGLRAV